MKSRTFFLGAGFSKALNPAYPTLAELSASLVSSFKARYPAGAIREHFDRLPSGFDKNVEQLLTYLYSDWPWKASVESDLDKALYKAYVYEIAAALENIPMAPISDDLRMFIHFMRSQSQNKIISLNYDNLIERYRYPSNYGRGSVIFNQLDLEVEEVFSIDRKTSIAQPWVVETGTNEFTKAPRKLMIVAGEWIRNATLEDFRAAISTIVPGYARNGMDDSVGRFYKHLFKADDFYPVERNVGMLWSLPDAEMRKLEGSTGKVLHLHGSVDWRGDSMGPTISLEDPSGVKQLERLPAIVPPVMDKSQHYAAGRFRDQWVKAYAEIQRSDEIVMIGFSFPLTDISCQFLFKSAVRPGTRIIVINPDVSLVERYSTIFQSSEKIELDFSYVGLEASLTRYVQKEVLMSG